MGGERISGLDLRHVQTNRGGEFGAVCVPTDEPLSVLLHTRHVYIYFEALQQTTAELAPRRPILSRNDEMGADGALGNPRSGTRLVMSVCRSLLRSKTKSGDKEVPNFQLVTFIFVLTNKKAIIKSYCTTGYFGCFVQIEFPGIG